MSEWITKPVKPTVHAGALVPHLRDTIRSQRITVKKKARLFGSIRTATTLQSLTAVAQHDAAPARRGIIRAFLPSSLLLQHGEDLRLPVLAELCR